MDAVDVIGVPINSIYCKSKPNAPPFARFAYVGRRGLASIDCSRGSDHVSTPVLRFQQQPGRIAVVSVDAGPLDQHALAVWTRHLHTALVSVHRKR